MKLKMSHDTVFNSLAAQAAFVRAQILVVEDDEDIQEYLSSLLDGRHTILHAGNGEEALQVIDREEIDLVISDIGMPVMDGFELLRRVRQDRQNLIPFLFLTAHTDKHEVVQALLLGVDAYVTKPFESDELEARVQGLLANNARRKAAYAQMVQESGVEEVEDQEQVLAESDSSYRSRWLKELQLIVNQELVNPHIRVPDLAFLMAVSERTFRKRIREYTGFSPHEYMMEVRMNRALQLLEGRVYLTVSEVAHAVGLEYSSYFTKQFKERFGKAPSEYL